MEPSCQPSAGRFIFILTLHKLTVVHLGPSNAPSAYSKNSRPFTSARHEEQEDTTVKRHQHKRGEPYFRQYSML